MLDVFLCFSPSDRQFAERLGARLERCAEAKVWFEQLDSESFVTEEWEGGRSSSAIVLVLSPDSVPSRVRREEWQPLLDHALGNAQPPIACVSTHSCAYPPLLERRSFFRWSEGDVSILRALDRWVVGLHEPARTRSFAAARVPAFAGRAQELDLLWRDLVDSGGGTCTISGIQGSGKSLLAQEFARTAGEQFRDVIWVPCGESSDAFILGDLAAQLGAMDARSIPHLLREHRLLVVFDDVQRSLPANLLEAGGRSSILMTTREARLAGNGPHVPLSGDLRPGLTYPALDDEGVHLWQAISVCRRQAASLALASRIAGMHPAQAEAAARRLETARLIDRVDARYVRVIERAPLPPDACTMRRRHGEEVLSTLSENSRELPSALDFAVSHDWDLARRIGQSAADFLRLQHRVPEAVEVLDLLVTTAETQGREEAARHFRWELSWIRGDSGEARPPMIAEQHLQLSLEW